MRFSYFIFFFSILIAVFSCAEQQEHNNQHTTSVEPISTDSIKDQKEVEEVLLDTLVKKPSDKFQYDLSKPSQKVKLPSALIEISALSFLSKHKVLLAVNDELGNIYVIEPESGKILKTMQFAGAGDYEGIEIVEDIAYVIKSNGNLVPVDLNTDKSDKLIKTALSSSNDVEGLAYDPGSHSLILACKGNPALKNQPKIKNSKAFYTFDIKKKQLIEQPKFIISDDQLKVFFNSHIAADLSKGDKKKLKKRLISFSPSAIALHPKNGNYFILSSVGKTLIICDEKGTILDVQFLSTKIFSQPEGIAFSLAGTMYISNEGRGIVANVLTFDYQ